MRAFGSLLLDHLTVASLVLTLLVVPRIIERVL